MTAHIQSNLPLRKHTIPVDENTVEVFHFDISPNGALKGTKPLGSYVDDSTVLYYNMADTFTNSTGTYIIDKSKYGNYGKVMGATIANGRNGKAMQFNGNSNYIEIKGNSTLEPENITVSAWIYMDSDAPTGRNIFMAKWNGYSCEIEGITRIPYFRLNGPGDVRSSDALILGQWYYFVGTFMKGIGSKIYLNGDLKGENLITTPISYMPNAALNIGRYAGGIYFKGKIDKVAILNRAISVEEVKERYNEGIYSLRSDGKYGGAIAIEETSENLLLNSNIPIKSSAYGIKDYYFSTPPVDGNTYTVSLKGNLAEGKSYFGLYNSGGSVSPVSLHPTDKGPDGVYRKTFIWKVGTSANTYLRVYHMPSSFVAESSIEWIQLEHKPFATSFTSGSRENGKLYYPTNIASPATISFWLKPIVPDNYSLAYNWVLSTIPYSNNLLIWKRPTETNYMMRINGVDVVVPVGAISYNKWSHIVITSNTSSSKVYIDGRYINSGGILPAITTLVLGYAEGSYNYSGNNLFDELRIDKVARTDEEILAWYLSESPFYTPRNERIIL